MKKIGKIIIASVLFASSLFADEYGLVLAGGGGKGAYEVGVWKALNEYGIGQKVTAISGTSVGGLNAGLFCCEPVNRVIDIWENMVPEELWNNTDKLIDQQGLLRIIKRVNLSKMNSTSYPKAYVTSTRARFWLGKLLTNDLVDYAHRFLLNNETDKTEVANMLLATSAFPVATDAVLLKDGYYYVDGGVSDNIPVTPLAYNTNLRQIIVVSLKWDGESLQSQFPYLSLVEIFPSKDLSGAYGVMGTADFSQKTIDTLITLGYTDTVKILKANKLYPVSDYWYY